MNKIIYLFTVLASASGVAPLRQPSWAPAIEHEDQVASVAVALANLRADMLAQRVKKILVESRHHKARLDAAIDAKMSIQERAEKIEHPWILSWIKGVAVIRLLGQKRNDGYLHLLKEAFEEAKVGQVPIAWRSDIMRSAWTAWYQVKYQPLGVSELIQVLRSWRPNDRQIGVPRSMDIDDHAVSLLLPDLRARGWRPSDRLFRDHDPKLRKLAFANSANLHRVVLGLLNKETRGLVKRRLVINPEASDGWRPVLESFLNHPQIDRETHNLVKEALLLRGRKVVRASDGRWKTVPIHCEEVPSVAAIQKMGPIEAVGVIRSILVRDDVPEVIYESKPNARGQVDRATYGRELRRLIRVHGWFASVRALLKDSSAAVRRWAFAGVSVTAPDEVRESFVLATSDQDASVRSLVMEILLADPDAWSLVVD